MAFQTIFPILVTFFFTFHCQYMHADYDIYDMIYEDDDGYVSPHKYPPHYFTDKYYSSMTDFLNYFNQDRGKEQNESSNKSQLIAFMLALFLGSIGAGRFYVGSYVLACCKLILGILACYLPCILACIFGKKILGRFRNQGTVGSFAKIGASITCVLVLGMETWVITDVVLFAQNQIPDENGLYLKAWCGFNLHEQFLNEAADTVNNVHDMTF
eukprot:245041_1